MGELNGDGSRGNPAEIDVRSIADLDRAVEALSEADRKILGRLLHVSVAWGSLVPPPTMYPWIVRHFGSVEATLQQKIVKVTNLVTFEGTLFNELRARRPFETRGLGILEQEIQKSSGDPFCHPLDATPADVFGRPRGRWCITASNIAKYDGFHGVIIFNDHNPFHFTEESVLDAIDTGSEWARRAHETDPAARYYFFMWNCLWKSGASILHGHAQVSMSHDMHYARVEQLRRESRSYLERYGSSYFDDLFHIHRRLGCTFTHRGVRGMASLTPVKEKELILYSANGLDYAFKHTVFNALSCYRDRLGVASFNLVIYLPPIAPVPEDWSGFPTMARLVDRGDPMSNTNDMGAMELFASSVVASDPLQVASILREYMESAG